MTDVCEQYICHECNLQKIKCCGICDLNHYRKCLDGKTGYVCRHLCWSSDAEYYYWVCENFHNDVKDCPECFDDLVSDI